MPNRTQMWLFEGVKVDTWDISMCSIRSLDLITLSGSESGCLDGRHWQEEEMAKADLITLSSSERRQFGLLSFSDLIWLSSSERRQSQWLSSAVTRDGSPDWDFPTVVDEFCLPVKLSPHCSLLVPSPTLATSRPGHRVFACLLMAPEGLGDDSPWKMFAFGSRLFHENFSQFHPLQKATFVFCLAWPPSRWPSFEHSSTKMGSLNIDPVYSTLCPRITSTHSSSKFYFNIFQYSVGGAVMPDAITYGQDCIFRNFQKMAEVCILRPIFPPPLHWRCCALDPCAKSIYAIGRLAVNLQFVKSLHWKPWQLNLFSWWKVLVNTALSYFL